jgi:putative transcriptional regulator
MRHDSVMSGLLIVLLALATAISAADPAPPGSDQKDRFLTAQLLVATDTMTDPRFHHTVIYLMHHDATGAMGVVVNRPLGEAELATLLKSIGRDGAGVSGTVRVHYGGPVEPTNALALHTTDWTGGQSHVVRDGVAVTRDPAILEAAGRKAGPRRLLFAIGYAGWAPGQLENEIARGHWITVPADEALIFDDDASTKWDRAMARRRITL